MIERRFRDLWERLQGKKPHLPHFLAEVHLEGIRGIDDVRIKFDYPVSVIAGGNASGKSTVLFAAACAYRVPGAGVKDFVPSTLFPDYRPKVGAREDPKQEIVIEFDYSTPDGRRSMRWRRTKGWNRSFLGRKNATQPERPVYLRTLSNLSNPSEVRGVLSMSRLSSAPRETPLTASQIAFAQQMLPFRYAEVVNLSSTSGTKNLLRAAQERGAEYSELHMAAGERAILRLSREIAQLEGALVLIDEVEAGLHPGVQQLLMLQLQQLALRNDLQVVVTTHSPVVLDSVPAHGRIFLERDGTGRVAVRPAYRDVVQNALYGRSGDALNLLCEDSAAEASCRVCSTFSCPWSESSGSPSGSAVTRERTSSRCTRPRSGSSDRSRTSSSCSMVTSGTAISNRQYVPEPEPTFRCCSFPATKLPRAGSGTPCAATRPARPPSFASTPPTCPSA